MITISKRITDIKAQLDELEGHVNSTLSILDCKKIPLKEYPKKWKDFKWREYRSYHYGENCWRPIFKNEINTIEEINSLKFEIDPIHQENEYIIKENTNTLNNICNFLIKLGFSTTTYVWSGKGKNRRSYQSDSDWVSHLKSVYPIVDHEYNSFMDWYKKETKEIEKYFLELKASEEKKEREEAAKQSIREENERRIEEQNMAINLAVEFLASKGKLEGKDFTKDTAIEYAFKLKNNPEIIKEKETKEINPNVNGPFDRMEL